MSYVLVLLNFNNTHSEKFLYNKHTKTLTLLKNMKMMAMISFVLSIILVMLYSVNGNGWCIADEQTPDTELQMGLDWACGRGANCSKIQVGQACFLPNTVRAHASYAFNNYYQKFKHKGGNCYFKGAAFTTDLDPSYHFCNYELTP